MTKQSQCAALLKHLKRSSITPAVAWQLYGIYRLAARAYDLRAKGFPIKTTMVQTRRARVARYEL